MDHQAERDAGGPRRLFRDEDGDGKISAEEMQHALVQMQQGGCVSQPSSCRNPGTG